MEKEEAVAVTGAGRPRADNARPDRFVTDHPAIVNLLAAQLSKPSTTWSLGTFGAIAEFSRDADEPVAFENLADALQSVTARGGIRIRCTEDLTLFASESTTTDSWSHRVSLCLPNAGCAMHRRPVLSELGPDEDALRPEDRTSLLFDLGLGALQVDACVRVAQSEIAGRLRDCCGRSIFEAGNPAMGVILQSNPHRVFISRVGRIEVFQRIPPPTGKSPDGPHTHVLPKLLQHKRTHAATEPVPEGYVPCAHFYPAHPAKMPTGEPRRYDREHHEDFQRLLSIFGDPHAIGIKERVFAAVEAAEDPTHLRLEGDRHARMALRVALRQLLAASRNPSPSLAAWLMVYDHASATE